MAARSENSNTRRQLLGIVLFLWVPFVAGAYYVVHKPWGADASVELLWPFIDLVLAASLISLAGGIGRRLLADRLPALHPLERVATEGALGLLLLGMIVLVLGLIGVLRAAFLWALLLVGLIALGRWSVRWVAQLGSLGEGRREWGLVSWSACALVLLLLTVSLLKALGPPTAWDALVYHLELPKGYLASARVGFNPDNLFVGFPQLAEMIYTWALALRAGPTAAVAGWMAGALGLVATVGFGRRVLGEWTGWMPAAILLTGGSLWQGLSWAYVDHWVFLFGAIAFLTLDLYAREGTRPYLVAAGVAAGCALGSKYTGGLVAAGCGMLLLYYHLRQRSPRVAEKTLNGMAAPDRTASEAEGMSPRLATLARDLLIIAGLTALIAGPWFLRNALQMGNPFYPFFFHGKGVDALRQQYMQQHPLGRGLLDALLLPWQASIQGVEGGPRFNISVGPLMLALIPALLVGLGSFKSTTAASLRRLVVVAIGAWILWALGAQVVAPLIQTRLYFGFLPALSILAAAGYRVIRSIEIGSLKAGWILSRFVLFVFLLTAVSAIFYLGTISPIRVLTGQISRQAYLEEQLGWYGRVMDELESLPAGSRVRFLWEPRAYYCQVDCLPDVILDQWWHSARSVGPPGVLAEDWAQDGVTHVLIYDFGVKLEKEAQPLLTEADWNALARFRTQELTLVRTFGDEIYSLYELR